MSANISLPIPFTNKVAALETKRTRRRDLKELTGLRVVKQQSYAYEQEAKRKTNHIKVLE